MGETHRVNDRELERDTSCDRCTGQWESELEKCREVRTGWVPNTLMDEIPKRVQEAAAAKCQIKGVQNGRSSQDAQVQYCPGTKAWPQTKEDHKAFFSISKKTYKENHGSYFNFFYFNVSSLASSHSENSGFYSFNYYKELLRNRAI